MEVGSGRNLKPVDGIRYKAVHCPVNRYMQGETLSHQDRPRRAVMTCMQAAGAGALAAIPTTLGPRDSPREGEVSQL